MRKPVKCEGCKEKAVPIWSPEDGIWICPVCYDPTPAWYLADPRRHVPAAAEWCER